jgi:hypothetical protein
MNADTEILRLVRRWFVAQLRRARMEGEDGIRILANDAIAAVVALDGAVQDRAALLDALRREVNIAERNAHVLGELARTDRIVAGLEASDTSRQVRDA